MSGGDSLWPGPQAVALKDSFDGRLGVEYERVEAESATARLPVRDELLDRYGCVPSGVYAAVAEGLASIATAVVVMPDGFMASGMSNDTSLLASVSSGILRFAAHRVNAGEAEWVWRVEADDGSGRPCAFSVVTVAVRALRGV